MHINRRTMRNAHTVVFGSLRMSMTCTRYPYCTFGAQAHEHCEHMYVDCTVERLGSILSKMDHWKAQYSSKDGG